MERVMTLLAFTIRLMDDSERRLVLDGWMRNTKHSRARIEQAMRNGTVLVAIGKGGLCMGWLAFVHDDKGLGPAIGCAFTKSAFRELGVAKALWERAGMPSRLLVQDEQNSTAKRVLKRLLASGQKAAS